MKAAIQKKFREKLKSPKADPKAKESKVSFEKDDDDGKKKATKESKPKEEDKKSKSTRSDSDSKPAFPNKNSGEEKQKEAKAAPEEEVAAEETPEERKAKRLGDPKKIQDPKGAKVKIDFDPILEADLAYIFDNDLSDISEYEDVVADLIEEVSQLDEVLSIAARFRKRASLRRNRNRIRIGRRRAMQRRATTERINRRARRSAISAMKRKFAGGRALNTLSMADRQRVERIVAKRPRAVANLTRRNVRIKRQQERQRFNRKARGLLKNEYEFYMEKFIREEWVDDGSSGGVGSPYQSGDAIANNINYNEELRNVCAELKVSPKELTMMSKTLGKYANELNASQARAIVAEYRKKYDK